MDLIDNFRLVFVSASYHHVIRGLIQFAVELIFGSCCRRRSTQSDSYRKIAPDDGLDSRKRRGGSSDRGDDNDAIVVFLQPIYIQGVQRLLLQL